MEAIVELIAALFAAVLEAALGVVQAAAALLAAVIEAVFLALTQGRRAAADRFQQRQQERREQRDATAGDSEQASGEDAVESTSLDHRQAGLFVVLAMFGIVGVSIVVLVVSQHVRQRRIDTTQKQIDTLADAFVDQMRDDQSDDPVEGLLPERDAWDQPIELFVDRALLGSLVVVRSQGPDRQSGTIDDLLATRVVRASAGEVGGELADRGIEALGKRVKQLLSRKKENGSTEGDGPAEP